MRHALRRPWTIVISSVLLVLVLAVRPITAHGAEYLPLSPGLEWTFECNSDDVHGSVGPMESFHGYDVAPLQFTWPLFEERIYYLVNDNAGPWLVGWTLGTAFSMGNGNYFLERWTTALDQAFRLWELPLVPSPPTWHVIFAGSHEIYVHREIGEETRLDTPFGELYAHPVFVIFYGAFEMSLRLYLHREIGPIRHGNCMLTAHNVPVAAAPSTWSAVRDLYR